MARKQAQGGNRGRKGPSDKPKGKVGSNPAAANSVGGKGDFGVPESDTIARSYTSHNTRASDPGAAQPHAGEDEGRVAGVGGNASGPGASSGGDIDTDIIGVGSGGSGIAQKPAGEPTGPDTATGTARDFASGPPTKNKKGPKAGKVVGDALDHSGGDIETTASGRGAAAASRPPRPDPDDIEDSFRGEVSQDEAAGQDSH
ncbi:MAG: hypothetical protein JWN40_6024 [Phycisphaerales bacterium]|nr:hypothetical protein [Phycisphaerales bacterium]